MTIQLVQQKQPDLTVKHLTFDMKQSYTKLLLLGNNLDQLWIVTLMKNYLLLIKQFCNHTLSACIPPPLLNPSLPVWRL